MSTGLNCESSFKILRLHYCHRNATGGVVCQPVEPKNGVHSLLKNTGFVCLTRRNPAWRPGQLRLREPSHMRQMLDTDRRQACEEQPSSPEASGIRGQRGGRVHSTAVNPSMERHFLCGVIFHVPIFRKEFVCLLSPTNALSENQSMCLRGSCIKFYRHHLSL